MLLKIPGSNGYMITSDGVILNDERDPVPYAIVLNRKIEDRDWLIGIANVRYVDEFDIDHLKFVFNPNSRSKFPWFSWYDVPKYADSERRYRVVPGYPNYAVDTDGNVVDAFDLHPYSTTIAHGYKHVYGKILRYRKDLFLPTYKMVALAWIPNPDPIHLVAIDHSDGNKLNNSFTNLKWVTYQTNSVNAVKQGLISSARKCRIRNIFSGEITEFDSLESMNKFLGLRAKEINHFLTRRRNQVYADKYEVRIDGDERPWVYTDLCQNLEPSRYIITVHEPSGDKVFNGVRTFIRTYGLWNMGSTSCAMAIKTFREKFPDYNVSVIDQYDLSEVEVRDIRDGTIKRYATVKDLILDTGWCKATILTAIKYNGTKLIGDNFVIRRKSDKPWPSDIREVKNTPTALVLKNNSTQEEFECTSIKDAARKLKRDRDYITRCIARPKSSDPFSIRLKLPLPRETEVEKKANC